MPPGERQTRYSVIINTVNKWLSWTFLAFWRKCYKKSTSWTPLYHLKICLICVLSLCKMHSRYDVTICWCFKNSRWWDFLSGLDAVCRSNCQQVYNTCCCSSRSSTASVFPFFNTLLQLILFSSLSSSLQRSSSYESSLGGATLWWVWGTWNKWMCSE